MAPDEDALEGDDDAEDDEEALDVLDEVELAPPAPDDEDAVLSPLPLQPTPTIIEKRRGTVKRA